MTRFLYTVLYRGDTVVGVYALAVDESKVKEYSHYPALDSPALEVDAKDVFETLSSTLPKAIAKRKKATRNVWMAAETEFEQTVIDLPHDELTAAYVRPYEQKNCATAAAASAAVAHSLGMP